MPRALRFRLRLRWQRGRWISQTSRPARTSTRPRSTSGAPPVVGAVIGLTGDLPFVSGGGSSHVVPDHADSPLQALRVRAGQEASVTYAVGTDWYGRPIPADEPTPPVSLERSGDAAVPADETWSYEGTLTAADDDEWTFVIHWSQTEEWTQDDIAYPLVNRPSVLFDGVDLFPPLPGWEELFVGGLTGRAPDGLGVRVSTVRVTAGAHTLSVQADGGADGLAFRLRRLTSADRAADLADAVAAARSAETAVVFAWQEATEGKDLTSLHLPAGQDDLTAAVAAANPRTVVVFNTASCVTMPWLEHTAAVLQMWYPGQEGAHAAADLLFGDVSPAGRLPLTFPADENLHPVAGDAERYPGVDGRVTYSEGIHVGYRWYDAQDVRPLFPFGHGLSYTDLTYDDLNVTEHERGLAVSFTVRNSGTRAGTDVADLPQAVRSLAAFQKVFLEPGHEQRVRLHVEERHLCSWSPRTHQWERGTGTRTVAVGASSRDLRLHAAVGITP